MTADQIENFFALAIGCAVAGLVASAYQLVTCRPASFHLLGEGPASVAAVPLIAFAASAPNPKFALPSRESDCELRVQKGH